MQILQTFARTCKKNITFADNNKHNIMIENPPQIVPKDYLNAVKLLSRKDISSLVEKINEKYDYWSDVKKYLYAIKV